MRRTTHCWLTGLGCAIVISGALALTYNYAFEAGRRRGGADAASEMIVLQVPEDLKLLIALLSDEHRALMSDADVGVYRSRLRGAITSAEAFVIREHESQGNERMVSQLRELVNQGKEIDRKLAPPASWWDDAQANAEDAGG